jgi:hypothetical protein
MREPPEFDCSECGRHIVVVGGPVSEFRLCAACTFLPGWFSMPDVAEKIDPEHHRQVRDA